MTRYLSAVAVACAFALSISAADAKPRHKQTRISHSESAHCVFNNDGRQTCSGAEYRTSDSRMASRRQDTEATIVAHPAGCPRRLFCGCGVSVKAFGRPIRELFLARNYGYYFNAGAFAPGNAAWRPGHVVYILGGTRSDALIYDPNSGGHQTRIHRRDLSRYHIADLNSPKRRLASR